MAGDDFLKGFDPLANMGKSSGKSGSGLELGWKIGTTIVKTFGAASERRRIERERAAEKARQAETLAAPPPVHGSAQWATADSLRGAGLLHGFEALERASSILLGALREENNGPVRGQLHWDDEGHLLTVAPTRSGKSTMLIVPNLLRYRGSCIVLDPKGELFRDTSAWRATHVGPVYRIAPFAADTDSFNPLAMVRSTSDARTLADLMIPDDPMAQGFFKKDAVAFLSALILYVARCAPAERRTLAEVRAMTASSPATFLDICRAMQASGIPAVANAANIVLGKSKDRGLPGLRDTLSTELSLWDDEGVIRASSRADVDFHALKDRPATVYITVPFDKMAAFAPFLKIVLTTALEAMIQNERQPAIPVLFILDEFLSLGPFPKFRDAIRTHAGAGARLWFFLQDLPTLEEHYGVAWQAFFNTSVKVFFGTEDVSTGRLISDALGNETVAFRSASIGSNGSASPDGVFEPQASRGGSVNESVTLSGRPLLMPTEVIQRLSGTHPDRTREAIVFARGVAPIRVRLVPWFVGEKLKQRIGTLPSPGDRKAP